MPTAPSRASPTAPSRTWASHRSAHMDETTTATSGRAASGGRVEKMGGQKKGPRKTSTPKKKPKQVQLPFAAGSKRAL